MRDHSSFFHLQGSTVRAYKSYDVFVMLHCDAFMALPVCGSSVDLFRSVMHTKYALDVGPVPLRGKKYKRIKHL